MADGQELSETHDPILSQLTQMAAQTANSVVHALVGWISRLGSIKL
jgi:hypothetical protein